MNHTFEAAHKIRVGLQVASQLGEIFNAGVFIVYEEGSYRLTIDFANPGEVQFARNVSDSLGKLLKDPSANRRIRPVLYDWLLRLG